MPVVVVVVEPPAERRDAGEPLMSAGCVVCHGSAACLDLNMLGQWLLLKEEAMLSRFLASLFSSCCPLSRNTRSSPCDDTPKQRQLGISMLPLLHRLHTTATEA